MSTKEPKLDYPVFSLEDLGFKEKDFVRIFDKWVILYRSQYPKGIKWIPNLMIKRASLAGNINNRESRVIIYRQNVEVICKDYLIFDSMKECFEKCKKIDNFLKRKEIANKTPTKPHK